MAFTVSYVCGCGQRLSVYLPKALVFGEWRGDDSTRWAAAYAEEELTGEVDFAERVIQRLGLVFVDGREALLCPGCGADLAEALRRDMERGEVLT